VAALAIGLARKVRRTAAAEVAAAVVRALLKALDGLRRGLALAPGRSCDRAGTIMNVM
jgi:hypothetical protein